ncbi:MAG: nucleoside recognition domain-containing protein [Chthoniobacteraceae bacterium]
MLNWIWLSMLVVAVLVGGFTGKLPEVTKGAFTSATDAVMVIALPLVGIMAIWLGIMRLAERAGLVQLIAHGLRPVLRRLFPDVPPEHPAMGAMVMNMAANMLGLGNAATPLGLRAMQHLEALNPRPGVATNAMCTFLAINTASIQLVPTTAIALLAVAGSKNPTAIVVTAFLATCCAACSGVFSAKVLERLPMFRIKDEGGAERSERAADAGGATKKDEVAVEKVEAAALTAKGRMLLRIFGGAFGVMFLLLAFPDLMRGLVPWTIPPLSADLAGKGPVIRSLFAISTLAVPFLLSFFPLYAALRGVKVYEQFTEGAKEAFAVAQRIVPFLVAMLVAIRMLREAGVIDLLTRTLAPVLSAIHFPADLLPMVLMRPLSGSATQGLFVELINRLGPDTLTSRIAGTIYGSTETTFYVLAVYFGSVSIRQTRHAVAAGLIADTVAVIASTAICTVIFR